MSVYSLEIRWPVIEWQNVKMILSELESRPVRICVGAGWKIEILTGFVLSFLFVLFCLLCLLGLLVGFICFFMICLLGFWFPAVSGWKMRIFCCLVFFIVKNCICKWIF